MKNKKLIPPLIFLITCGITVFLLSFKTIVNGKPKPELFWGKTVTTQDLHNALCSQFGPFDPNVYGCFDKFMFHKYTLYVHAPPGWHFTGTPYVRCTRDNDGAFGWNNFPGAHDRFYITSSNATDITAIVWAGSHSIDISLACEATQD